MTTTLKTKQLRRALSTMKCSLSSKEIRKRFLEYFINENDHRYIKSSPVLSYFDSSIPFVNAGMCQFKRIFTSQEQMKYDKVANSQKCIRIAGKHNDLQAVGIDSYHHTFFEMLGNWSFGSYDKKKACKLAWELLISPPYNIPSHKLFVTYFGGDNSLNLPADEEVREIWLELGVKPDHILPFGTKDNFWEMGAVGPCGTCTEIHVALTDDLGSSFHLVNGGNPLLTELWNIVFIRYNRKENGSLELLPREYVDTGMGFERLVTLLQNKTSNYDTDLFHPMFDAIHKRCKVRLYRGNFSDLDNLDSAYRYLADFSRMVTVAVTDGVFPEVNPKLRRVLRKAIFIAQRKFYAERPDDLIFELSNIIADSLHDVFPEIGENLFKVKNVVENEFKLIQHLENKCDQWREIVAKYPVLKNYSFTEYPGLPSAYEYLMEQISNKNSKDFLPSQTVVNLYITYGLEKNIIEQLLEPLGLKYNPDEVRNVLELIREASKQRKNIEMEDYFSKNQIKTDDSFKYLFEEKSDSRGDIMYKFPDVNTVILAVIINNRAMSLGDEAIAQEITTLRDSTLKTKTCETKEFGFICEKTNFYTNAGGQCYDTGTVTILKENGKKVELKVHRAEKRNGVVTHFCYLEQLPKENFQDFFQTPHRITLKIDAERRCHIMQNHTASHLLSAAVKEVFPVSHFKDGFVNDEIITSNFAVYGYSYQKEDSENIEKFVKTHINNALPVNRMISSSTLEVNNLPGITFTPGAIYNPDDIYVLSILENDGKVISREPCCGTHLDNTRYIRDFCVTKLSFSKSLSTLIIEAVTGERAEVARHYGQLLRNKTSIFIDQINNLLSKELPPTNEIVNVYEALSQLLFELKYNKDCVKNVLPCDVTEDFHKLKTLQKQINRIVLSWSRETVATGLFPLLHNNSSQCNVITKFFALKHEALKDSEFMRELILLNEFTSEEKTPVLCMTYVDGSLRCFCYIPEDKISEHFNARSWLSSVLETSSFKISESENTSFCHTVPKRTPEENISSLVSHIIDRAKSTSID